MTGHYRAPSPAPQAFSAGRGAGPRRCPPCRRNRPRRRPCGSGRRCRNGAGAALEDGPKISDHRGRGHPPGQAVARGPPNLNEHYAPRLTNAMSRGGPNDRQGVLDGRLSLDPRSSIRNRREYIPHDYLPRVRSGDNRRRLLPGSTVHACETSHRDACPDLPRKGKAADPQVQAAAVQDVPEVPTAVQRREPMKWSPCGRAIVPEDNLDLHAAAAQHGSGRRGRDGLQKLIPRPRNQPGRRTHFL